jgi:hypothetical protein
MCILVGHKNARTQLGRRVYSLYFAILVGAGGFYEEKLAGSMLKGDIIGKLRSICLQNKNSPTRASYLQPSRFKFVVQKPAILMDDSYHEGESVTV